MSKQNPRIIKNAAFCLVCKEEIESKGRWDFISCKCGNVSVDGGKAYIRRCFKDLNMIEERCVFDDSQEPTDKDYNTV